MKQIFSILCNLVTIFIRNYVLFCVTISKLFRRNIFTEFWILIKCFKFVIFIRYQIDNGEKFSGKTVSLVKDEEESGIRLQLIFGPDDVVYWVDFTKNELENQTSLSKMVRLGNGSHYIVPWFGFFDALKNLKVISRCTYDVSVERGEDTVTMRDELNEYKLTLSTAFMWASPYQTT